jgi:uncharacterized protein
MKPSLLLNEKRLLIREIVAQHHACNARVFGSALRGDDREDSDLDILVDTTPATTLFDIARIQNKLSIELGIPVDVVTPKALPPSFLQHVLNEAKEI